ncbi:MAG TPA: hypothetical protein DF699_12845 [Phycisphaerales bacterium]|nr:hypothetical protein [Phycisphaerales bacterium]
MEPVRAAPSAKSAARDLVILMMDMVFLLGCSRCGSECVFVDVVVHDALWGGHPESTGEDFVL